MVQAVSSILLTRRHRFEYRLLQVGRLVYTVTWDHVSFLDYSSFPVSVIPPVLHTRICIHVSSTLINVTIDGVVQ